MAHFTATRGVCAHGHEERFKFLFEFSGSLFPIFKKICSFFRFVLFRLREWRTDIHY